MAVVGVVTQTTMLCAQPIRQLLYLQLSKKMSRQARSIHTYARVVRNQYLIPATPFRATNTPEIGHTNFHKIEGAEHGGAW